MSSPVPYADASAVCATRTALLARAEAEMAAATGALSDVLARRDEANVVLEEAQTRFESTRVAYEAAQKAFNAAQDVYNDQKRALSALASDVSSAQQLLDAAVHKLALIRAPPSPIYRLPPEILGVIFEHTLHVDFSCVTASTRFDILDPFKLALVCRAWRHAALVHPRTWANINIDLDGIWWTTGAEAKLRQYLSLMLARSMEATLNIRIVRRSTPPRFLDVLIIKDFIPHLGRCRTLALFVDLLARGDSVLPILQAELPIMHELRLTVNHWSSGERHRIILHAPALRFLTTNFPFFDMTIPLPKLVSLSIQSLPPDTVHHLLATAPALRSLELTTLISPVGEPDVLRSRVETLTINTTSMDNLRTWAAIASLHRHVEFQALKTLHLPGNPHVRGVDHRTSYFADTANSLKSLTRVRIAFDHHLHAVLTPFLRGLASCPSLQRIDFIWNVFVKGTLQRICDFLSRPSDVGIWPCPNLTVIDMRERCGFQHLSESEQESVVALVEKRMGVARDGEIEETLTTRPVPLRAVYLPRNASSRVHAGIRSLLPTSAFSEH